MVVMRECLRIQLLVCRPALLIVVSQDVRERWRGDIHDAYPVTARSS
jgi:hypothetical protein